MLSAAKHLCTPQERPFASLRVTSITDGACETSSSRSYAHPYAAFVCETAFSPKGGHDDQVDVFIRMPHSFVKSHYQGFAPKDTTFKKALYRYAL